MPSESTTRVGGHCGWVIIAETTHLAGLIGDVSDVLAYQLLSAFFVLGGDIGRSSGGGGGGRGVSEISKREPRRKNELAPQARRQQQRATKRVSNGHHRRRMLFLAENRNRSTPAGLSQAVRVTLSSAPVLLSGAAK